MTDVAYGSVGTPVANGDRGDHGEHAELPEPAASTMLAREDSLSGRLQIRGSGTVLGTFSGKIECEGDLTIGPEAHVEADIRATRVSIAGFVRGNVTAGSRLKIASSGRLEGDARVGALVVHEGGVHHGVIRVHPEGVPERTEPLSSGGPGAAEAPRLRSLSHPVVRVRKFWGEFF
jgi:cytoskeletal protein CcmA (bactofilin family)